MNKFLRRLRDPSRAGSPANILRRRRFLLLKSLFLDKLPQGTRILDVGGTPDFWMTMGSFEKFRITLLNLTKVDVPNANLESVVGDAKRMPQFADGEFDLVFSNSVIEHVGAYEQQLKMADEIRRVGKGYFVQTPNYWFPFEPHFLLPFFQFFPVHVRTAILRYVDIGEPQARTSREYARELIALVHLLTKRRLRRLFPDAYIRAERICGLTKSYMVYREIAPAGVSAPR
jgi:2-polyprenyl-3-methyl-5-hydroxy-6-metoxy-1,4-benzoquinol methylase